MDQWRAARLGRVDILDDILAEEGANPNLTRWSGSTALHKAAAEGHADCVELLLDKGADVNMRAAWGWYSPLHLAMRGGHEDVGMLLLERGGNWEAVDKHQKTPMRWAIDAGHVVAGNECERRAREIKKARLAAERAEKERLAAEAERLRLEEEERRRRAEAEREARERAERERARAMAEAAASVAARVARAAASDAADAAERARKAAAAVVKVEAGEPEFYKRLKAELSEEDFEALLHCKPKMAAQFGLTPKQFKQLKKTARLQGKLEAELRGI